MAEPDGRHTITAAVPDGYFAPDGEEHTYLRFGGRVTWPRLLLRFALAAVLLAAVDSAVALTLTPRAVFEHDYRLPRTLPTSSLPAFAASVHDASLSRKGGPVIAFVGASPTWGYRIKDPANTYPASFQRAGAAAGWPNRTYNFASSGQFLGDEYLIAKGISSDADVVFVQLTYHTFNPEARNGAPVRYREIPLLLHLDVTPAEARLLGTTPTVSAKASSRADALLGRYWLLWRERDALDRQLFGAKPQNLLGRRPAENTSLTALPAGDEAGDARFVAFDKLDPMQRMIVVSQYSENSSFSVDPADSEVRFLRELAALLAARHKKAVFFVAPLNRQLIGDYELIDPKQYAANVAVLRAAVASSGADFPFIDYNTGPTKLPGSYFADVSHTTDAGGRAVGALLYGDTWRYLGAKRP